MEWKFKKFLGVTFVTWVLTVHNIYWVAVTYGI